MFLVFTSKSEVLCKTRNIVIIRMRIVICPTIPVMFIFLSFSSRLQFKNLREMIEIYGSVFFVDLERNINIQ